MSKSSDKMLKGAHNINMLKCINQELKNVVIVSSYKKTFKQTLKWSNALLQPHVALGVCVCVKYSKLDSKKCQ